MKSITASVFVIFIGIATLSPGGTEQLGQPGTEVSYTQSNLEWSELSDELLEVREDYADKNNDTQYPVPFSRNDGDVEGNHNINVNATADSNLNIKCTCGNHGGSLSNDSMDVSGNHRIYFKHNEDPKEKDEAASHTIGKGDRKLQYGTKT